MFKFAQNICFSESERNRETMHLSSKNLQKYEINLNLLKF